MGVFFKKEGYISPHILEWIGEENKQEQEIYKKFASKGFPFDVVDFATYLQIKLSMVNFEDKNISGAITKTKDGVKILTNKLDILQRQYFTIAHELGHFFLHKNDLENGFIDYRSLFIDDREKMANKFAAELLMPEEVFHKKAQQFGDSEKLAKFFRVSLSACLTRLTFLGYNSYLF